VGHLPCLLLIYTELMLVDVGWTHTGKEHVHVVLWLLHH
jgi:hypothetical protein